MLELKQAQIVLDKATEYALSFEAPLEQYFFTQKQKDQLEKEKTKLDSTIQYVTAVLENPELDQDLDRAVAEGKIYSPAMTANIRAKARAMYDGMGPRWDLARSLVSNTGQFVLLSESCSQALRLFTDGYLTKEELPGLLKQLASEGIEKDVLEKMQQAAEKHGALIIQRGAFIALRPMLEEALAIEDVRHSYNEFKQQVGVEESVQPPHGSSIDQLKQRLEPVSEKPKAPAMTAQEIKREVMTKELPDFVPAAKPARPAIRKPVSEELNKVPRDSLKSVDDIKTIEDLKMVEPAHLRQGLLPDLIKKLKAKIVYLAAVNKQLPIVALNAFEQSPLFRQYLKIGGAAITGGDSKAGYVQVMARLKEAGEDVINLYEFEAIADLRKSMERM